MSRAVLVAVVAAVVVVLGAYASLFIVEQTEQAIVLQFGQFKRVVREPGLKVKAPWQTVVTFSKQLLDFEPPPEEVIAADQKRMVVDSFARYRIRDPLQFFQSLGTEQSARNRLGSIISGSLRRVLGGTTIASVLSEERDRIMKQITEEVATQGRPFGIDVIDVRLRRADLPEENSQAIYARMQSERQREAYEFRAQGAEFAQRIKSIAERERTVILAEAQRQSEILRGQGEGESVKIYADAFGKDADFFGFYRTMKAYREALSGHDTTLVLSPEGEFFRYFSSSGGGGATQNPAAAPSAAPGPGASSAAR